MAATSPTAALTDVSTAIDAFVRLLRANAAVTRRLSTQLTADHGLSLSAYEALLVLSRSEEGMRRVDLADDLLLTAGGVTRLLDGLERDGLVARRQCDTDRRVSYAVLTETGRDRLRRASESHTRQIGELMGAALDGEQLAQLAGLLDRIPGVDPTSASCTPE
jgi:MarR family 2-MHQ and catechol resistance regulon transcriptional repressor